MSTLVVDMPPFGATSLPDTVPLVSLRRHVHDDRAEGTRLERRQGLRVMSHQKPDADSALRHC